VSLGASVQHRGRVTHCGKKCCSGQCGFRRLVVIEILLCPSGSRPSYPLDQDFQRRPPAPKVAVRSERPSKLHRVLVANEPAEAKRRLRDIAARYQKQPFNSSSGLRRSCPGRSRPQKSRAPAAAPDDPRARGAVSGDQMQCPSQHARPERFRPAATPWRRPLRDQRRLGNRTSLYEDGSQMTRR
jgi:hypothetical protein